MPAAILLAIIPAIPILLLGMSPEYWGRIYLLWGAGFAAMNVFALYRALQWGRRDSEPAATLRRALLYQGAAWCASFVLLAAIDLTPLCLNQDNGDGRNSPSMVLILTPLWFFSVSMVVIPLIVATAYAFRKLVCNRLPSWGLDPGVPGDTCARNAV